MAFSFSHCQKGQIDVPNLFSPSLLSFAHFYIPSYILPSSKSASFSCCYSLATIYLRRPAHLPQQFLSACSTFMRFLNTLAILLQCILLTSAGIKLLICISHFVFKKSALGEQSYLSHNNTLNNDHRDYLPTLISSLFFSFFFQKRYPIHI